MEIQDYFLDECSSVAEVSVSLQGSPPTKKEKTDSSYEITFQIKNSGDGDITDLDVNFTSPSGIFMNFPNISNNIAEGGTIDFKVDVDPSKAASFGAKTLNVKIASKLKDIEEEVTYTVEIKAKAVITLLDIVSPVSGEADIYYIDMGNASRDNIYNSAEDLKVKATATKGTSDSYLLFVTNRTLDLAPVDEMDLNDFSAGDLVYLYKDLHVYEGSVVKKENKALTIQSENKDFYYLAEFNSSGGLIQVTKNWPTKDGKIIIKTENNCVILKTNEDDFDNFEVNLCDIGPGIYTVTPDDNIVVLTNPNNADPEDKLDIDDIIVLKEGDFVLYLESVQGNFKDTSASKLRGMNFIKAKVVGALDNHIIKLENDMEIHLNNDDTKVKSISKKDADPSDEDLPIDETEIDDDTNDDNPDNNTRNRTNNTDRWIFVDGNPSVKYKNNDDDLNFTAGDFIEVTSLDGITYTGIFRYFTPTGGIVFYGKLSNGRYYTLLFNHGYVSIIRVAILDSTANPKYLNLI